MYKQTNKQIRVLLYVKLVQVSNRQWDLLKDIHGGTNILIFVTQTIVYWTPETLFTLSRSPAKSVGGDSDPNSVEVEYTSEFNTTSSKSL